MNKKGFTLVELLAVIAILAILVIIALPNIMSLFNQAKQNSFENEVKQIFKASEQEWMKDSMIETQNIVYSRCEGDCPNELQLSGRTNIDYYVEVDKGGNVVKLFATDDTYQYEYRGKGLKIEQIGGSKQIANLESSEILKVSCDKIEIDGEDVTNISTDSSVSYKIFWALQDNDGDSSNETLVISNSSVNGNESGNFKGNAKFTTANEVPWHSTAGSITTIKIEGEVAPVSTAYWFYNTGSSGTTFNADLSNLNVSNVSDMSYMFYNAGAYLSTWSINGISNWDTSNVTNMNSMFQGVAQLANEFNIDLSNWDTSNVTNMSGMFSSISRRSFDSTWSIGDIGNWNTSNVTDMSSMFSESGVGATTFNLDLSNWNTSKVTDMHSMFYSAGETATTWSIGDISNWNTSNVTDMSYMFYRAGGSVTNWTIGDKLNWDILNVRNMSYMFQSAGSSSTTFYLDLSNWKTSNVTNMNYMFQSAGLNATTWEITIPKTNGNGTNNTTSRMYGKDSSIYADANESMIRRPFTLAS